MATVNEKLDPGTWNLVLRQPVRGTVYFVSSARKNIQMTMEVENKW
jgi:hypothetical protein